MSDAFVPMREWLLPAPPIAELPLAEGDDETDASAPAPEETVDDTEAAIDDAIGRARRFRASLSDAVALMARDVIADIAADVLARELHTEPCELSSIVTAALQRYAAVPVRVRVHPDDAEALGDAWPVIVDGALRRGDVIIETGAGSIDARLGVRLARVLAAADA